MNRAATRPGAGLSPNGIAGRIGGAFGAIGRTTSGPVYLVLAGVFLICFALVTIDGGTFLSVANVRDMLVRSVALGIVAAGQTLVILGASLDLSVAYVISLTSIIGAETMDGDNGRIPLAVGMVLLVGLGIGLVNGLVITKLRVNAFIATLGMALIIRGYLEANYAGPAGNTAPEFLRLGRESWGPVPFSVILLLAVVFGVWLLLRYSRFGNRLYAVGGDEQVAKLSGVRTHRVMITAHVLCAMAAAITGLFLASRLGAGSPLVGTDASYDLQSIAAVVLGGTYLLGGRGGVLGTLAGVLILAMIDNTFVQLEINAFARDVVRGLIIIAAVAAYSVRWRKRRRSAQASNGVGTAPPGGGTPVLQEGRPT